MKTRYTFVNSGQTLIEIVVAVGIISLVLVGVSDIISRSMGLSSFQSDSVRAINLAQNQLNYYRGERDKAPRTFFENLNNYKTCRGTVGANGKIDGKFDCSIEYVGDINSSIVKMTVKITWDSGKKDDLGNSKFISTELSQDLANPI